METYTIERLGHLGDGIADGPVYVPGTLPGEVVTGTPDGQQLRDVRIVTPSPDRVTPPCRHARACGGCQLQFASESFTEAWKREIVGHALSAHGIEVEIAAYHLSPPKSRRRAGFSARRTKKGAQAGFHRKGSDVIVEVPDCLLLRPALVAALPLAEALAVAGASRKHELTVQITESEAGLDVAVSGGKTLTPADGAALADLAREYDLARLSWGDDLSLTRRPPLHRFGRAAVIPPPGAFLQATREGEAALLAAVRRAVGDADRVLDLFAGCGTFSLPLAETAEVHAVEGEAPMLAALDRGWREAQGLKRITTEARDLFRNPLLPEEMTRFDAVVIDPPRAGAEAQVAELARARIPRIAHVSCNPVSFARDTATLIHAGYRLHRVEVVDQFRWSSHTELAAYLTCEE